MNAQAPPHDPEDPRLTAYALGELTDPADLAAVEQTLQTSPEARTAVQEIRALTATLIAEYDQERLVAAENVVTMFPMPRAVPPAWPRRLLLAAAVVVLASVARLTVPGWHTAIYPPRFPFQSSKAAVAAAEAPRVAPVIPAGLAGRTSAEPPPGLPVPAPSTSDFRGLIADAQVAREVPPADDALRARAALAPAAPVDLSASRVADDETRARGTFTKDEPTAALSAKPSEALALNAPPLSQGGLGGAPVASAPASIARAVARRAAVDGVQSKKAAAVAEEPFVAAKDQPVSTFPLDVDTASYAEVRRFIASGRLPPPEAVRIAGLINAFPSEDTPGALRLEAASCPWNPRDRLVRVGIGAAAGDGRVRVTFDPAAVASYRLIGGGSANAGPARRVATALYEVALADADAAPTRPWITVTPGGPGYGGGASLSDRGAPGDLANASPDFKFTAAVAGFGQILRGSSHRGDATLDAVLALARAGLGADPGGERAGFIEVVRQARALEKTRAP